MKNRSEVILESVNDERLGTDSRWLLVQRILASGGFQKAEQLRKILVYVSRLAILEPNLVLREHQIACEALNRRQDFDPSYDNIVRVQFLNLRRKLEHYFSEEGRTEPLVLTIPKGSYQPIFVPAQRTEARFAHEDPFVESNDAPVTIGRSAVEASVPRKKAEVLPEERKRRIELGPWQLALAAAVLICMTIGITLNTQRNYRLHKVEAPATTPSPFLEFLAKRSGNVTIVLPDMSEMMLQLITAKDISAAEYANGTFSAKQIETVNDPEVRMVLSELARRRNTTVSEALAAFDFTQSLHQAGVAGSLRYARDLHVRDLNEGNSILIGSKNSDPWVSLFSDQINFQFTREPNRDSYYFKNLIPISGEQDHYEILPQTEMREQINYVDVAYLPNPSRNGYILLINGSDNESNEAAVRLLLHGSLPKEIASILARKDVVSFELLLRGKHIRGEANDKLEMVATRTN